MQQQLESTAERGRGDEKVVTIDNPGIHLAEAAELYGSQEDAEAYNYVSRGLKSRHIQLIGLGGSIGTGLFLSIGRALTAGGPLSMLLTFAITGVPVFGMMQCLGELVTWLPIPGATPTFATRYVDPALGFAIGWMGWYTFVIAICQEVSAVAVVIQYWDTATNPAVWLTITLLLILCLNIFAVSIYGEAEFWFASLKIITIVGLLILALVIDLGGGPDHERLGFRYWQNPGAMATFIGGGDLGRFTGFAFCLILSAHTYAGVDAVAIAAGEAQDPRKALPKAIRRVFWRIVFFYVIGALAIGVLVPYNSPSLLTAEANSLPGAAGSPWVIAIDLTGIDILPSIINAVILTSAMSSANAYLYNGSRYLMALAQSKLAPKIFMRCSQRGIPYYAVGVTTLLSCLAYLTCSSTPDKVFVWLSNVVGLMSLTSWITICVIYLRFYEALKKQGVNRDEMPFKSPFQPYLAWSCIISFSIIMLFNGFYAFAPWNATSFISVYISFPVFICFFAFWKIYKKTKLVNPADADIWTGKAVIDAQIWPVSVPKNFLGKVAASPPQSEYIPMVM